MRAHTMIMIPYRIKIWKKPSQKKSQCNKFWIKVYRMLPYLRGWLKMRFMDLVRSFSPAVGNPPAHEPKSKIILRLLFPEHVTASHLSVTNWSIVGRRAGLRGPDLKDRAQLRPNPRFFDQEGTLELTRSRERENYKYSRLPFLTRIILLPHLIGARWITKQTPNFELPYNVRRTQYTIQKRRRSPCRNTSSSWQGRPEARSYK